MLQLVFERAGLKRATKKTLSSIQNTIFEIALLNPLYSATNIISQLPKQYQRITVPTVQKI